MDKVNTTAYLDTYYRGESYNWRDHVGFLKHSNTLKNEHKY